ncbi:MAG TPA: PEP-CTERM sorting domain-containing protein [Bryobacteraceae bacterium]|jgi:hypothetical protein
MIREIGVTCLAAALLSIAVPGRLTADAVTLPDCVALKGLSDCLVLIQVELKGGKLVPTAVDHAGLTEADEANGKSVTLTSPALTIDYTEGSSSSFVSDRVTIGGFSASFSSDPSLQPVPPGVTPIDVVGETLGTFQVAGFSFVDFPEGSAESDAFTLHTEAGPRTAVISESQEPFTFSFTQPTTVFDFLEPPREGIPGAVEDRLVLGSFTVTFTSGGETSLPAMSGAITVPEASLNTVNNAVAVLALSDVPEPSTLVPLSGALLALAAGMLRRRMRR